MEFGSIPFPAVGPQLQAVVVPPSGDISGRNDVYNLNAAINFLSGLPSPGGQVYLASGIYYWNSQVTLPYYVSLIGQGWSTVINYSGNGSALFINDPVDPQSLSYGQKHDVVPRVEDFTIDGSNAGTNAILLDTQDMSGGLQIINVNLRNAHGANAAGWRCANNRYAINNVTGNISIGSCTTGILFTTLGSENAIEHIYMNVQLYIDGVADTGTAQTGVHITNSVTIQGSNWNWDVSIKPDANCVFELEAGTGFSNCVWLLKAELTTAASTATSIIYNSTAGVNWTNCRGNLYWSPDLIESNITTQQFQFDGEIINDSALQAAQTAPAYQGYGRSVVTAPAIAASGTPVTNNLSIGCLVYLVGGTLTAPAQVNGTARGITGCPVIYVPNGYTITLFYSSAPTWEWQPVGG